MTRADIIRMAREAGLLDFSDRPESSYVQLVLDDLERFVSLVADAEREARQSAQAENEQLKERLARAGVDRRKAVYAAIMEEREACIDLMAFHGGSVELEAAIRARSAQ